MGYWVRLVLGPLGKGRGGVIFHGKNSFDFCIQEKYIAVVFLFSFRALTSRLTVARDATGDEGPVKCHLPQFLL